jgi:N-methylhydantoinase B
MQIARIDSSGVREELPISVDVTLMPGEKFLSEGCGGGGYGNPLERDPLSVLSGLLAGRISESRANRVYGVAFSISTAQPEIDEAATAATRAGLLDARADP